MSSTPRISVLMTVFNAGRFLAESVESILGQSFSDFEFVIVDDASTDGSVAVLESYASRDPRIRLFCNRENSGQTACLNQGLAECRADWVARQDADDLSHPERLSAQWRAMGKIPALVLLGVNGWIVSESGRPAGMIHAPLSDAGIRWSLPFRNPFVHTGVLFRRLHRDGSRVRFDPDFRICQDWELWFRLSSEGPVANLPARLVSYRHRKGSLSTAFSERTRDENRAIVQKIWRANFPNWKLTQQESELLESFRIGLTPARWPAFNKFYSEALAGWVRGGSIRTRDRQAEAVHMIQAAGAMAGSAPFAAALAVLKAFSASPGWTATTLLQRFRHSDRVR